MGSGRTCTAAGRTEATGALRALEISSRINSALAQPSPVAPPGIDRSAGGEDPLGETIQKLSAAFDAVVGAHAELARRTDVELVAPLADCVAVVGACKEAVGARETALRRFNAGTAALAAKRAAFEKEKALGAPNDVLLPLKGAWEETKLQSGKAKAEHALTVKRLDADYEGFERTHVADLKRTVCAMASMQLEHAEKEEAAWREMLALLQTD